MIHLREGDDNMPWERDSKGNLTWQVDVHTHENGKCPTYEQPHIHCRKNGNGIEYRLRIDGVYCGDFMDIEPTRKEREELIRIAFKYKVYCNDLYLNLYEDILNDNINSISNNKQLTLIKEI